MSLPRYKDYYPFILKNADVERTSDEYLEILVKEMNISEEEQLIKNLSGEPKARNRLRWGIHYLRQAGLMNKPSRGKYVITDRGKKIREEHGLDITNKTLEQFEEFLSFRNKRNSSTGKTAEKEVVTSEEDLTPNENIEQVSNRLKEELKMELIKQIMELSSYFFEKLVIDLLKKMGYGSFEGTTVTPKTSDGGIDGIVYQDVLGLDIVYVQAKRYKEDSKIGTPDLQKFIGTLSGLHAAKGIFFTTSSFTPGALEYLKKTPQKIVTVDGNKLLDLMIDYEVGTRLSTTYNTYKIDGDYFSE